MGKRRRRRRKRKREKNKIYIIKFKQTILWIYIGYHKKGESSMNKGIVKKYSLHIK